MARKGFYNIKDLGELPKEEATNRPNPAFQPPHRPKVIGPHKLSSRLVAAALVVLILAVGGVTAWFVSHHHQPAKPAKQAFNVQPATGTTKVSTSQQYVSNGSDLNWSVTPPTSDNTTDQTITLISPLTTITDASGANVTGKVTLTVRPGTATPTELNANTPTAAATSAQIAYSAPTTNQYQYPYITFIHFSTGLGVAGAFEEVMVTGTSQFTQGQAVSVSSLIGLDPVISAVLTKCTSQACTGTGAVPLSISNSIWTNTAIFQQTLAVFESFKLN